MFGFNDYKNNIRSFKTSYERAKLIRVNRKNPCPICNKPDWCSVSENGAVTFCCRVSTGSIKQASNGAYIHILKYNDAIIHPSRPIAITQTVEKPVADIDQRNKVYSALLNDYLILSPQHSDNLLNVRELSDERVAYNGYATLPDPPNMLRVSKELASSFELNGVPGFFKNETGDWRFSLVGSPGFFIPIRDPLGRIQGLQIRRNSVGKDQSKYIWFSSRDLTDGASSGSPIHFVNVDLAKQKGFAVITEGPLKADICAEKMSLCFIAVAGVSSFNNVFAQQLKKEIPQLKTVAIAFDSDWEDKSSVCNAVIRLIDTLKEHNINIKIWTWDTKFKGLDDFILAGGEIA
jgi:hypothetical protein